MKKRILALALALCMVLGMVPSAAFAAEPTIVAAEVMHRTAPNSEWHNTLSAAEAMYDDSTGTYKVTPQQGYTWLNDQNSISLSSFEDWDLWCYSTDMTTVGEAEKDPNVVPYFIDVDDSNRKWVLTGVQYSIKVDNQTSSEIIGIDTLQTNDYIFDYRNYCVCPNDVFAFIVTFTYLWDVSNESGEDGGPITVTYDFNTADDPTSTQIPANAEIYGIEHGSGNISSYRIAQASKDVVKNSVPDDTIIVGDIEDHFNQYEELIAMAAGKAGEVSYYRLTGWNIGGTTHKIGTSYVLGSSSIVLNAQWEKIMDTEMAATFVEKNSLSAMELTLTTSSNALIEQKSTSMTEYTSGNIVLDDNGIIDYRATVCMDPTIAAFLGGKVVSNPEFANFEITVNLDSSLKLIADDQGNVTFTFTCPFMKPKAVEVAGESVEGTTISQNGSQYTITVPASALSSEGGTVLPFVISVQWVGKIGADNKYTVYSADELAAPMTLETQTSVAEMTDYTKQIATTGSVSGVIDFVAGKNPWRSNGIHDYDIRTLALGIVKTEQAWSTLYKKYAENGNELVVLLAAVETLKANNLTGEISGNTVHASYPNDSIITATAGAGGSITPSGSVTVGYGADQTFTITANNGYCISDVLVDGRSVGVVSSYTFENVSGDHTIEATFRRTGGGGVVTPTQYTITAEAGDGGSISPSGKVRVDRGDDQTFRITPDDGYEIADVLVDGESVGAVSSYTFENVRANHTIEVVFERTGPAVADPDDTGVSDWLNTEDHIQYLFGYPDGTFGPGLNMTRAEAAQMFYNLLVDQDVTAKPIFDDVPEGAWYAEPVNVMAKLDIVEGVGDNKFEPNREITRAEFTAMAMRFAEGETGGKNIFSDVDEDDWFYEVVVDSIKYGWIEGYPDGTFRPANLITREEVTTIVNRMLGRLPDEKFIDAHEDDLDLFPDVTKNWAYYDVVEATNDHQYKKTSSGEDWTKLG